MIARDGFLKMRPASTWISSVRTVSNWMLQSAKRHAIQVGAAIAFLGMTIPRFLMALVLVYLMVFHFDVSEIGSFFSPSIAMVPSALYLNGMVVSFWASALLMAFRPCTASRPLAAIKNRLAGGL